MNGGKHTEMDAADSAPGRHPFDRHPLWLQALLAGLTSTLIGVLLAWLSNFSSVAESVKRMSARLYMPALSDSYGLRGRDHISVLTIDDEDLKALGLSWPVPLSYYQRLIDKLAVHRPRALFVDLVFLDSRPDEEVKRFGDAACAARALDVRVYLASLHGQRQSSDTEDTLLARRLPDGTACITAVAPNVEEDRIDRSAWNYPLRTGGMDSAALAMACGSAERACPDDRQEALALVWGRRPAPSNEQIMQQLHADQSSSPICRSEWSWLEVTPQLGGLLRQIGNQDWLNSHLPDGSVWGRLLNFSRWSLPLCPYNRVVPVRALQGYGFSPEELHGALNGKLLLLGTDFQSQGDHVMSPLQGRVAGVHVHAMALDNLLTYEGAYRRAGDLELLNPGAPASVFTFVAVLGLSFGMTLWAIVAYHWQRRDQRRFLQRRKKTGKATPAAPPKSKGKVPYPRAIALFLKMVLLRTVTLGRLPALPTEQTLYYRLGRPVLAVLLALLGILLLFKVGDSWMRVGPLSLIEFLLFPLGVEFLHGGRKAARFVSAAWDGAKKGDPVGAVHRLGQLPDPLHQD